CVDALPLSELIEGGLYIPYIYDVTAILHFPRHSRDHTLILTVSTLFVNVRSMYGGNNYDCQGERKGR
ncbi:MAG: hypothetical protein ACE5NN_07970, partial [Candidatus Bathyarchaeia archaeon]